MCFRDAHLSEAVDTVKASAHEHVNATRERAAVFMTFLSGENWTVKCRCPSGHALAEI